MARPGLTKHPKFLKLCRMLMLPGPHVFGLLEFLWAGPYETGSAHLGDVETVEAAAEWDGESGMLCDALLRCGGSKAGFIEPCPDIEGEYLVHDLFQNAPEYVTVRHKRETERNRPKTCVSCHVTFYSPDSRGKYCSQACRQAAYRGRHSPDVTDSDGALRNGVTQSDAPLRTVTDSDGTPAPAPAPAPAPKKELPTEVLEKDDQEDSLKPDDFIQLWASTSRHHGIAAVRKWTPDRRAKLRTRLAQNGWWGAFQEAAKKLPLPGDGWQPDADWFLANDQNVYKILEGKYDWRATKSGGGRPDPAAAHDPDRPCEAL